MTSRIRSYRGGEEEESKALLGDDEIPLASLHPKKREGSWSPVRHQTRDQTIETDIQPSDTILSVSLKYNVPLAEMKRVNNIIRDDEFYALKRIKIPVRPTSLLNELLPGVHSEENRKTNGWFVESKESPKSFGSSAYSTGQSSPDLAQSPFSETRDLGESLEPEVGNLLGIESLAPEVFHESKNQKKVKRFLRDMDRDLARIKEKQTEFDNDVIEEVCAVTETENEPEKKFHLKASQIPTEDPGCSNRVLGCWCVVVGVLIILVFCVLVSLMRIDHDKHNLWPEATDNSSETLNIRQAIQDTS